MTFTQHIHMRKDASSASVSSFLDTEPSFVSLNFLIGSNSFSMFVNADRLDWARNVAAAFNAPADAKRAVFISAEDLPKHPNGGL